MTVLEDRLAEYLRVRRQLGFKLKLDGYLLADFVAFLEMAGVERITSDLSVLWARRPGASARYHMERLSMVRGFARYLAMIDPATEIPPIDLLHARENRNAPYLYCEREIAELIRNGGGHLRGVLRYDPFGPRSPKMRALPGSRLGLVPHPARETSPYIIRVEGPPDMIAARSCSLAAIAVPGTNAWRPDWSSLLAGRHVTVVMDCDQAGRHAAEEIAESLAGAATTVEIVDLWPDRDDGYDLTDRILERRRIKPFSPRVARAVRELLAPHPSNPSHDRRPRSQRI
jgi:hypothetical protein